MEEQDIVATPDWLRVTGSVCAEAERESTSIVMPSTVATVLLSGGGGASLVPSI